MPQRLDGSRAESGQCEGRPSPRAAEPLIMSSLNPRVMPGKRGSINCWAGHIALAARKTAKCRNEKGAGLVQPPPFNKAYCTCRNLRGANTAGNANATQRAILTESNISGTMALLEVRLRCEVAKKEGG